MLSKVVSNGRKEKLYHTQCVRGHYLVVFVTDKKAILKSCHPLISQQCILFLQLSFGKLHQCNIQSTSNAIKFSSADDKHRLFLIHIPSTNYQPILCNDEPKCITNYLWICITYARANHGPCHAFQITILQ